MRGWGPLSRRASSLRACNTFHWWTNARVQPPDAGIFLGSAFDAE
ncbi:hypothetical protein PQB35_gp63 [Ochrobactrum phage vB_OspP_OH]|uniref:Uncharacterized protein n=1 Tax=Ochrobactrum phage vB_OspP_OH TaxID=2712957 RepID=A0A6G6XY23_9CAUD|nr:hypothetical protein PQB35_gp63 [Ochrobactrum phage vB_OspP_OH]QIG66119.1 hypothetical protein phiOH_p63 [Ochrobactrum phage vB_OspP_OH]